MNIHGKKMKDESQINLYKEERKMKKKQKVK